MPYTSKITTGPKRTVALEKEALVESMNRLSIEDVPYREQHTDTRTSPVFGINIDIEERIEAESIDIKPAARQEHRSTTAITVAPISPIVENDQILLTTIVNNPSQITMVEYWLDPNASI